MNIRKFIQPAYLFFLAGMTLAGCASLPKQSDLPVQRIATSNGPEDIVFDDYGSNKRLLISCANRRCESDCPNGDILSYDLRTRQMDTLKRIEEPAGMVFHPHGIDLVQVEDKLYLYVVNHNDAENLHFISRYKVVPEGLIFTHNIESEHFRSPNAVSVLEDGTVFVSNDSWTRHSLSEILFKKKKSTVVRVTPSGKDDVVAMKISYGNGVAQRNGYLFQASTRSNVVYRYTIKDGTLTDRAVLAKGLVGADNLRWDGKSMLVACHLHPLAFMRHVKKSEKRSPSTIYRIPMQGGKPELVYFDKGNNISASSTAIIVDEKLYIGQVFEPWILEVDLNGKSLKSK